MLLGGHLGAKMRKLGAKISPSWPTWRQDVPKMANLEVKMANLAHFWEHLDDMFWILGAILPKIAKTKKTTIVQHFLKLFAVLGVLLEAMLAHLGAMLGYVEPSWRHLGATWRQDGTQERQNEPRERPRAPT